ncbi:helix-turn-helix domain-containing protein [Pontiella sulfatireligans]|uniref:HTH iclR-type domain-containing protein n=1 Tax=Pontiella sulfatireligans TaxID=2750658 RepID=A0A6C2UJ17_9BACT|nr:helix-turn-helix domain-containing protein [Pontiella sulfatireligans]VGO19196.1 hypothetical protein SCARR_01253 [Pontiella sulfatireligans]
MSKHEPDGRINKYHIPNREKACELLELVSNTQGGCPLKEIATQLSIPHTTALLITETLLDANYLAQNEEGGFPLGTSLVQLGVKALDRATYRS